MEYLEWMRGLVWGPCLLLALFGTGILCTIRLGGFQFFRFATWWKATAGEIGTGKKEQLLTSCTALAATVGTGNIVGVATALSVGGPGAVFWMWVSAFFGMATAYAEVYLGIRYRKRGKDGLWIAGPFLCLENGLDRGVWGRLYAGFVILASLGMGSMVQANSAVESLEFVWGIHPLLSGLIITALVGLVIFGGVGRIAGAASVLVPVSAGLYLFFGGIAVFSQYERIPVALALIVKSAVGIESAVGGVAGYTVQQAIGSGVSRGVFSNEAGLGSLAVLHGNAGEGETPESQGMWAIFEVFFDTIVCCSLTAMILLCVGGEDIFMSGKPAGAAAVAACFSFCFGPAGGWMTAICLVLFAFATIIAWFYLGRQAVSWLAEKRLAPYLLAGYGFLYLGAVLAGCLGRLEAVWAISDIFNGLMAIPNLAAVAGLLSQVKAPKIKRPLQR